MATPFIAEITMFGGTFAPRNYALCNGALISIAQNTALFALIGTIYGGNGTTTFGLPNLQGRLPVHSGQGPGLSDYSLGQSGGSTAITLTTTTMPTHTHATGAGANAGAASVVSPVGAFPATPASGTPYADSGTANMAAGTTAGSTSSAGTGKRPRMRVCR